MAAARVVVDTLKDSGSIANMLEGSEDGAWAPISLSESLKSNDNLEKVELMGLETQSWTLQERLQVLEPIKINRKILEGFEGLS